MTYVFDWNSVLGRQIPAIVCEILVIIVAIPPTTINRTTASKHKAYVMKLYAKLGTLEKQNL